MAASLIRGSDGRYKKTAPVRTRPRLDRGAPPRGAATRHYIGSRAAVDGFAHDAARRTDPSAAVLSAGRTGTTLRSSALAGTAAVLGLFREGAGVLARIGEDWSPPASTGDEMGATGALVFLGAVGVMVAGVAVSFRRSNTMSIRAAFEANVRPLSPLSGDTPLEDLRAVGAAAGPAFAKVAVVAQELKRTWEFVYYASLAVGHAAEAGVPLVPSLITDLQSTLEQYEPGLWNRRQWPQRKARAARALEAYVRRFPDASITASGEARLAS